MNYAAPWWLPGGNLQTIWAALRSRRYLGEQPLFRRERWATPDNDFVDVDWLNSAPTLVASRTTLPPEGALRLRPGKAGSAAPAGEDMTSTRVASRTAVPSEGTGLARGGPAETLPLRSFASRNALPPEGAGLTRGGPALRPDSPALVRADGARQPLLVVFHGLEGSSASHYAEAFADVARTRGWACAVPHFRGCSGELNLGPRAYHSGDFEEIDWILKRFATEHAGPVMAVGISLGGNALMRWAAEEGAQARQIVAAVASVCSPLDMAASGWAIGRGFNRQVYTRMFLRSMVPKALMKLDQHPGLFDRDKLLAARDLYQFDNIFTAPVHGFKNVDDYWDRASAKPHLHRIAVPALVLNALNDPFIPPGSLPQLASVGQHVTLWQPATGGHVGFPSGPFPAHVRAMPEAVASFLASQL
jgi:uncharacterized protein